MLGMPAMVVPACVELHACVPWLGGAWFFSLQNKCSTLYYLLCLQSVRSFRVSL